LLVNIRLIFQIFKKSSEHQQIRRSMNASYQKELPLYTPEIYNQVIDLPVEKPPLILSEPLFQKKSIWNSY